MKEAETVFRVRERDKDREWTVVLKSVYEERACIERKCRKAYFEFVCVKEM